MLRTTTSRRADCLSANFTEPFAVLAVTLAPFGRVASRQRPQAKAFQPTRACVCKPHTAATRRVLLLVLVSGERNRLRFAVPFDETPTPSANAGQRFCRLWPFSFLRVADRVQVPALLRSNKHYGFVSSPSRPLSRVLRSAHGVRPQRFPPIRSHAASEQFPCRGNTRTPWPDRRCPFSATTCHKRF
jgi:hypothetical protein